MTESTVAIVGSGIVGTAIAYFLTQKGYDVEIFEKGLEYPYPHMAQFREQRLYSYDNPAYHLPADIKNLTLSGHYPRDLNEERIMVVGGSATQWTAIALRMAPHDFKTKSLYGYGADWPIAYDDLEPYYYKAEVLLGVSGTNADNPAAPWRSNPYPLPPFELSYDDALLGERLREHDIILHTTPQARARAAYDSRPACANFGSCRYCPIGARYSPTVHLQRAIQTGLCKVHTNTSVRRIVVDKSGQARALVYQDNNSAIEMEHSAKIIIVAAGAIESTRLLLLSTNAQHPNGIGNNGGQLGQHLTFHHLWYGRTDYEDALYTGRFGGETGEIHQFIDPPERGKHGGIKVEFSSQVAHYGAGPLGWTFGEQILEDLKPRIYSRLTIFHAESIPSPQKHLVLSEQKDRFGDPYAHVHYQSVDFDYETHTFAQKLLDKLAVATRATTSSLQVAEDFESGYHHMGTCRMGQNVGDSVVDQFCRVHDVPNLFVVGGSNFTMPSAVNPTLTMTALGIRTADYLLDQAL